MPEKCANCNHDHDEHMFFFSQAYGDYSKCFHRDKRGECHCMEYREADKMPDTQTQLDGCGEKESK